MNCNNILERIGDYLDSELDGAERKQVRAHLESCAECQRAYTEVASIKRVVQTKIVQPPLPGALAGRVFRKTRSEAASRRTAVSVRRALPAIAALLLFGLTTFLVIRVWVIGELPLAHARAIKDMTDKYGEFKEIPRPDPELFGKSSEQILQLIRVRTGVQLDALPEIDKSMARRQLDKLSLRHANLAALAGRLILIHGREDTMIPYTESLALKQATSDAELFLIDGFSHLDTTGLGRTGRLALINAVQAVLGRRR